jgi:hypothetical protein
MKFLSLALPVAVLFLSMTSQAAPYTGSTSGCYLMKTPNNGTVRVRVNISKDTLSVGYQPADGRGLGGLNSHSYGAAETNAAGDVFALKASLNDGMDGWDSNMEMRITATTVKYDKMGSTTTNPRVSCDGKF